MPNANTKRLLIRALRPLLRAVGSLFYDRSYLRGRYFDEHLGGWIWMLRGVLFQKILGFNRDVPWPVNPFTCVSSPPNITFDPDDLHIFQVFGCYYQCLSGRITIGKGIYIAPNVGLITSNHDPLNLDEHLPGQDIVLGEKCWIGMNSVILPGVRLGARTIVGAGAVVTRSFPEGNCVLGGIPARKIRDLDATVKACDPPVGRQSPHALNA